MYWCFVRGTISKMLTFKYQAYILRSAKCIKCIFTINFVTDAKENLARCCQFVNDKIAVLCKFFKNNCFDEIKKMSFYILFGYALQRGILINLKLSLNIYKTKLNSFHVPWRRNNMIQNYLYSNSKSIFNEIPVS